MQTVQPAVELCRPSVVLSRILRLRLGSRVGFDQPGQGVWWDCGVPFYPGFRRSVTLNLRDTYR